MRWSGVAGALLFVEHGALPLSQLLVALDGSDRGMRVYAAARDFAQAVGLGLHGRHG